MHSFLCFSKIGFLHDIDLYLGSLSLENCDFDSKQLSLPVAISACRAAPMGANPLGHTFKPLTLYDISIYTIYFSHPFVPVLYSAFRLWLITASGWCVLARFPVHALTLPLVHVQQDVQFVQTGGLCFQLVLLRKWLLYLELCTGKLGLISGEVVLLGNEIALN